MLDITKAEVWVAGFRVLAEAPHVVIPLLFLVAGVAWWFRGALNQAKMDALAAQKGAITDHLQLAEKQEADARRKLDDLEKTVRDLTATKGSSAGTEKVAAALSEVRNANTALYEALRTAAFSPEAPPSLTYTTPKKIVLNGTVFDKSKLYWNPLLFETVRQTAIALGKEKTKSLLEINHADGLAKQENGFRYIEEADLSVQGQDANRCWSQIYKLAKNANLTLEVEFVWQNTPKAAYPNLTGKFSVN